LEYIQDGDTVILDAGTTTLALALALLGREALTIFGRYRANKAFLGSSGFTAKRGHCKPNPADAQIKESIIGTKLFKIWSQLLI
jgi:DeoR/GlpR family transcriptional regulator of sugar metabolism